MPTLQVPVSLGIAYDGLGICLISWLGHAHQRWAGGGHRGLGELPRIP